MAAGEDATRSPAHRALGRATPRSRIVVAGHALEPYVSLRFNTNSPLGHFAAA